MGGSKGIFSNKGLAYSIVFLVVLIAIISGYFLIKIGTSQTQTTMIRLNKTEYLQGEDVCFSVNVNSNITSDCMNISAYLEKGNYCFSLDTNYTGLCKITATSGNQTETQTFEVVKIENVNETTNENEFSNFTEANNTNEAPTNTSNITTNETNYSTN